MIVEGGHSPSDDELKEWEDGATLRIQAIDALVKDLKNNRWNDGYYSVASAIEVQRICALISEVRRLKKILNLGGDIPDK